MGPTSLDTHLVFRNETDIDVANDEGAVRIPGHIHEVAELIAAAEAAHLDVPRCGYWHS